MLLLGDFENLVNVEIGLNLDMKVVVAVHDFNFEVVC